MVLNCVMRPGGPFLLINLSYVNFDCDLFAVADVKVRLIKN